VARDEPPDLGQDAITAEVGIDRTTTRDVVQLSVEDFKVQDGNTRIVLLEEAKLIRAGHFKAEAVRDHQGCGLPAASVVSVKGK
jgi:hypothetical protein